MTERNPLTGRPFSKRYFDIKVGREKLPVFDAKARIQKLVRQYQCLLLVGETGSGKTTQVPQFLLEMQPEKKIGCTQPRRVAAMSVADRVAEEMDVELGEEVGYTIRFDDMSCDKTKLKYLTDGMLLREAMTDPLLKEYSVIMIDEAHERTVQTDILLGALKVMLAQRPELRVVVMSATLEQSKFQSYFPQAPVVHVTGRQFGVEVYCARAPESNYVEGAIRTVLQIHESEGTGDVLLFLTGEDEIETAVERISHGTAGKGSDTIECLPLYSALPPGQQKKVFKKTDPSVRKVVVATNIAETSLTIDGIVFVVDAGFAKQKVFNPKVRVESLLVTPISQAAALQRTGRAGRTKPGKCFRMYTKTAFREHLQPQTHPEILRCNLGSVVLDMKKMGVDDLVHFDFIDPPAPETLMRALEMLNDLEALTEDGDLTTFGERLAAFPLEPELAALLLHSERFKCPQEAAKIAAMLSVQNPYTGALDKRAQRAKEQWMHQTGDHMTLLQTYEAYEESGMNQEWARENYLNARNMQQAASVTRQLLGIMTRLGIDCSVHDTTHDRRYANHIRKALVAAFFTKVAMATPTKNQYQTLKDGVKAVVYPSSVLKHRPQFVIFNELVLTTNTYVRTCTSISDDWLVETCPAYFQEVDEFAGLIKQQVQGMLKAYARRQAGQHHEQHRHAKRGRHDDDSSDSE